MPETKNKDAVPNAEPAPLPQVDAGVLMQHQSHAGPILAVLVIILVLVMVGLYLWGGMLRDSQVAPVIPVVNNEPETTRAVVDEQILRTLSSSDDLSAIEADVSSTNFDGLDVELLSIDAEIEAALKN